MQFNATRSVPFLIMLNTSCYEGVRQLLYLVGKEFKALKDPNKMIHDK